MIRIENLDKHYRGKRRSLHVLDDVSLDIPAGSFFTLLGPSGSGKTTIMRVIAGLEQHDGGRVSIDGRVVSDPANGLFVPSPQRGLGMVFQSYAIWPNMDVFGNVTYPLKVQRGGPGRDEIRTRAREVLETVGLHELIDAPATALSGGQQQRVALARALISRPGILLLDEPLSNLDAQLRERMRGEIRDLQRKLGITTVYVTHDRSEALSMSTQIAVMNRGRIEMVGTPIEIYERPRTNFTADFVGPCNRIAGTLAERLSNQMARIETANGALLCQADPSAAAGDPVTVIIRPEDIEIGVAGAGERTGTLKTFTYLGDRAECDVTFGDQAIRVTGHPSLVELVGKPVAVRFRAERCWALAAGAP